MLRALIALLAFVTSAIAGTSNQLEPVLRIDHGVEAVGIAVSPDGAHIYVCGERDRAIAVYTQDPTSGRLSLVATYRDGEGGVQGLERPYDLVVSPDGAHVYAVSNSDDRLAVFARAPGTGALSLVQVLRDGVGGVDGLDGAVDVATSPDGSQVYVAASGDRAVAVFSRDPGTGTLTLVEVQRDGIDGAVTEIALSNDGAHLYAAEGDVAVFARNGLTGALTLVEVADLPAARSLAPSPGGEHLYVGLASQTDFVAIMSRDPVTGMLSLLGTVGSQHPLSSSLGSITVSPDGGQVYAHEGIGYPFSRVIVFDRDPGTGALSEVQETFTYNGPWRRAAGFVVHPAGSHAFAVDETGLVVFARAPGTGLLTEIERNQDIDDPAALVLTPDGAYLYVAGLLGDAVVAFARDAGTGDLAVVDAERDRVGGVNGLDGPIAMALSPDAAHLYVAALEASSIVVFARDATTGALDFVETQPLAAPALHVAVSPDGAHIYAGAAVFGNPLAGLFVFERDATTGALAPLTVYPSFDVRSIAFNADGTRMYAAGDSGLGSEVMSFARQPETGLITLLDRTDLPDGGVSVSNVGVALDPTGTDLYVVREVIYSIEPLPDELLQYRPDPNTGRLTRRRRVPLNLRDTRLPGVVVSPDGRRVFVDGPTVLTRSLTTGAAVLAHGTDDGFGAPRPFAVAAGGAQVYVGRRPHALLMHEPATRCSALPMAACRLPMVSGKATIKLEQRPDAARALLVWKWVKGDATVTSEFGTPSPSVTFCLYDATGLLMTTLLPPGGTCAGRDCWRSSGTRGFRYRDRELTPDGVGKAVLRAGAPGFAKVAVTLRGTNVPAPTLPLVLPVTAQLQSADGACWSATYGTASSNDGETFAARAD
jgi:6-phosphogluconolactonase (cycloisomerase 2 family)